MRLKYLLLSHGSQASSGFGTIDGLPPIPVATTLVLDLDAVVPAQRVEVLDLFLVLLFTAWRCARSEYVLLAVAVLEVVRVRAATEVLVGGSATHGDVDCLEDLALVGVEAS